jgi:hypothetical protein
MSTEIPNISCKEQLNGFYYETWEREQYDAPYHFGSFLENVAERAGCSLGDLLSHYNRITL